MNLNRDDKVEIGTRNGKTNLMVNSERLVEAERWVPADVRTALNAYAKLHADILSETDGPTGLQYRNMFKDEKVFDTVFKGTGVTFKGVQGTLVEGCESYIGKSDYGLPFFQFHVEKEYYVGQGKNLECSPPRNPVVLFHTTYRVKVDPKSPNCLDRWEIDRVYCGFAFSKWSMGWDLRATSTADISI